MAMIRKVPVYDKNGPPTPGVCVCALLRTVPANVQIRIPALACAL